MIHGILYRIPQTQTDRKTIEDNHAELVLNPSYQQIISLSSPQCWLAQATEKSESPLGNKQVISRGSRFFIVAWARLDNHEKLAQDLDISLQELKALSAADLILNAYVKFGSACTTKLVGDFSFAIYDNQENILFCARDQMGIKPFYY